VGSEVGSEFKAQIRLVERPIRPFRSTGGAPSECLQSARLHGARTLDIARADDMELDSRSDCQWFINSVEVRISP